MESLLRPDHPANPQSLLVAVAPHLQKLHPFANASHRSKSEEHHDDDELKQQSPVSQSDHIPNPHGRY
jgi:hypothetical protein